MYEAFKIEASIWGFMFNLKSGKNQQEQFRFQ